MNRNTIEDALFPDCPIRNILARLGDKWSLLVVDTHKKFPHILIEKRTICTVVQI